MNTQTPEPETAGPEPVNATTCPACGFSNNCTLADPRTADQACWCFSATIDPAVLAALPDELRNKACLCPRCAGVDPLSATPL